MSAEHLIVFDVDGTLVDSQRGIVDAMIGAFAQHDLDAPDENAVRRIVGLSLFNAVERLLPGHDADFVATVAQSYKDQFLSARMQGLELAAFPGVLELVRDLQNAGYLMGVATGNSKRGLAHTLEVLGLEGVFLTEQTADDHPSKPHPSMLHRAMEDMGVECARAVMIGDTSYDMEMAGHAKVHALGVSWGYHGVDDLRHAGAHHVAQDAIDLRDYLQGWSLR